MGASLRVKATCSELLEQQSPPSQLLPLGVPMSLSLLTSCAPDRLLTHYTQDLPPLPPHQREGDGCLGATWELVGAAAAGRAALCVPWSAPPPPLPAPLAPTPPTDSPPEAPYQGTHPNRPTATEVLWQQPHHALLLTCPGALVVLGWGWYFLSAALRRRSITCVTHEDRQRQHQVTRRLARRHGHSVYCLDSPARPCTAVGTPTPS